jgi:hypothetical protein
MSEKEIKEKAEQIIEALTSLSLGNEPTMFSNEAFRKLCKHDNFLQIRDAYVTFLNEFNGGIESPEDIKRLFDFRMKIVKLFYASTAMQ